MISKENPAGINIRRDDKTMMRYHELKDLRSEARSIERRLSQGYEEDSPTSLWQQVAQNCQTILNTQSKDCEIAAWLIEALVRTKQFSGLKQGLKQLADMIDQTWDSLYPLPEDNDYDVRLAPIAGLSGGENPGTLITPLLSIAITQDDGDRFFAFWQYQQALQAAKITSHEQREQRETALGFSMIDIEQARDESGADFYQQLQADISESTDLFKQVIAKIQQRCPNFDVSSSNLERALQEATEQVRFLLESSGFKSIEIIEAKPVKKVKKSTEKITPVSERQQALQQLSGIAAFFEQTEPHSPLPFLLRRAVNWGNLSLPELLQEMISSEDARTSVFKLTGIKTD